MQGSKYFKEVLQSTTVLKILPYYSRAKSAYSLSYKQTRFWGLNPKEKNKCFSLLQRKTNVSFLIFSILPPFFVISQNCFVSSKCSYYPKSFIFCVCVFFFFLPLQTKRGRSIIYGFVTHQVPRCQHIAWHLISLYLSFP